MFKFLKKIFRPSDTAGPDAEVAGDGEDTGDTAQTLAPDRSTAQPGAAPDPHDQEPAHTPDVPPARPPEAAPERATAAEAAQFVPEAAPPQPVPLPKPVPEPMPDVALEPKPEPGTAPAPGFAPTPSLPHATPQLTPPAPAAPHPPSPPPAPSAVPAPSSSRAPSAAPVPPAAPATVPALPAAAGDRAPAARRDGGSLIGSALVTPLVIPTPAAEPRQRERWVDKLKSGLRKTGGNISGVFTGAQITEELYEDLESALLMADAGVPATQFLLADVRRRVKAGGATHPIAVRNALVDSLAQLLKPLEKELVIGEFTPTVIMVAGVNGAGKTTSIGKLTKHLANAGAQVLLAAADTFRAAAREQLGVWADRNTVEIVSQEGGDPAAVSYDAVMAGKARGKDVVLVDTAGRLPTQLHLMEELKKIKRVVQKADPTAPHEILLVIDGNTGQNALAQVKAFDAALALTGLIVTKLDGTAKGGVLAAIAQWGAERARNQPGAAAVPVYFIGVGEKLEDLETFNAREFAQALLS